MVLGHCPSTIIIFKDIACYISILKCFVLEFNLTEQSVFLINNLKRNMIGNIVLVAEDNAEYSASNVDKATSVCRNDFHINGHGPRNIIYPVRDLTEF